MHWQRLDRDTSIKVIDSVKSDANAGMFSVGTSEVERARVPFYNDLYIYRVTNFASLPSFTFEYLSDGIFFNFIDGTETPIHLANDKGALELNPNNVLPYLSFYFEKVSGEDGDIILINNPHDMPLLDSLDADAYDAVFNQYKPAEIKHNSGLNSYNIEADIYSDSQLVRAEIEVSAKGRVKILSQKMNMHGVVKSDYPEASF